MITQGDWEAEAFAEDERKAVLALGPKRFGELMEKATKMVKKANAKVGLNETEREDFVKIPLIIRKLAIDSVAMGEIK